MPDIVIAYDLWQYWLAPLCVDLTSYWILGTEDRMGLPQTIEGFGRFFDFSRGVVLSAFPILRNPMVLWGSNALGQAPQESEWDWATLVSHLGAEGAAIGTNGFVVDPLYPEATEAAYSAVAAYGGTIGQANGASCIATFAEPAAVAGVEVIMTIVGGGRQHNKTLQQPRLMRPSYLWDGLWGSRRTCWSCLPECLPLPSGPRGRYTPCMYLCASLALGGKNRDLAADFCSFLMSPVAQKQMASWAGALALRKDAAQVQLAKVLPMVGMPGIVASSDGDMVATDVFGGDETVANSPAYTAATDSMASALVAAEGPSTNPSDAQNILQHFLPSAV